jgi:hypothetical protein
MTHLLIPLVASLVASLAAAGCWLGITLRPPPIPIEVVSGDRACRRRWQHLLGNGVRRLQRLTGAPTAPALALLVVDSLPDGQRAALSLLRRRGDGRTVQLVRLALSVPERRLAPDEVLAVLAEQYLAVTVPSKSRTAPATVTSADAARQVATLLADLGNARNGSVRGG